MKYGDSQSTEKNILDIKVEDDKKDITEENEEKNKESLNSNKENNILDITIKKTEKTEKEDKQIEDNSKKEEIKISRYDEIRKIRENSKKEAIEKLRKQLDMTIRNNISLNRNNNLEDNTPAYNPDEKIKHDNILKLHKEGLSNKEIATQLKCSLTEVDIIIELNNN